MIPSFPIKKSYSREYLGFKVLNEMFSIEGVNYI